MVQGKVGDKKKFLVGLLSQGPALAGPFLMQPKQYCRGCQAERDKRRVPESQSSCLLPLPALRDKDQFV